MKVIFSILILTSCINTTNKPQPPNASSLEPKQNWEFIYSQELKASLFHEDDKAFHFFWPYYLQERHFNKCKKYNTQHNISCYCPTYK